MPNPEQWDWVTSVLGVPPPALTLDATASEAAGVGSGLAAWRQARDTAIGQLKQLASAVAATKNRDRAALLAEIDAIIRKLNVRPDSQRSAAALRRYIAEDDTVAAAEAAPEGFKLELRKPLLAALDRFKPELPP